MRKTIYLLAIALTMSLFYGCKKDEPTSPTPEPEEVDPCGIYLGVVGFNFFLQTKDICQLTNANKNEFYSFIDNFTFDNDGTALYYADYTALNMMQAYSKPPELQNVFLVTFTDGLDNESTNNDAGVIHDPEHYGEGYGDAIHNRILNQQIHGLNVSSFSIGLMSEGASQDNEKFTNTLRNISSDNNNVYLVDNMNQVLQTFNDIADSLHTLSSMVDMVVAVRGGYDDLMHIRFNVRSNPPAYIQATYRRVEGGRILEDINYYGLQERTATLHSDSITYKGVYFTFPDMKYSDGSNVDPNDIKSLECWIEDPNWHIEAEFHPDQDVKPVEKKSSAMIMLVLDCTRSLGADKFQDMQRAGKSFIETLLNASSNKKKIITKK
ncbi:MAG: VWA domain-containing protein [Bacteroidales bacterium]|nr:VWA domain-containing protein [Bacteroidales bacterium]